MCGVSEWSARWLRVWCFAGSNRRSQGRSHASDGPLGTRHRRRLAPLLKTDGEAPTMSAFGIERPNWPDVRSPNWRPWHVVLLRLALTRRSVLIRRIILFLLGRRRVAEFIRWVAAWCSAGSERTK